MILERPFKYKQLFGNFADSACYSWASRPGGMAPLQSLRSSGVDDEDDEAVRHDGGPMARDRVISSGAERCRSENLRKRERRCSAAAAHHFILVNLPCLR